MKIHSPDITHKTDMGGVAAEVFKDRALALPPLNASLARRMLRSLKSWPLLKSYRGKPGANIDRLVEIIMRFSYLVADYPEEFVTQRKLKDDVPVTLRPIKPEDEPLWHDLLGSCSTESIWFRFSYLFKQTTHEMVNDVP